MKVSVVRGATETSRATRHSAEVIGSEWLLSGKFVGRGTTGMGAYEERLFIIARSEGPFIPCVPAILLAKRLARGELKERGARPLLDLTDLAGYFNALDGLDIQVIRSVESGCAR